MAKNESQTSSHLTKFLQDVSDFALSRISQVSQIPTAAFQASSPSLKNKIQPKPNLSLSLQDISDFALFRLSQISSSSGRSEPKSEIQAALNSSHSLQEISRVSQISSPSSTSLGLAASFSSKRCGVKRKIQEALNSSYSLEKISNFALRRVSQVSPSINLASFASRASPMSAAEKKTQSSLNSSQSLQEITEFALYRVSQISSSASSVEFASSTSGRREAKMDERCEGEMQKSVIFRSSDDENKEIKDLRLKICEYSEEIKGKRRKEVGSRRSEDGGFKSAVIVDLLPSPSPDEVELIACQKSSVAAVAVEEGVKKKKRRCRKKKKIEQEKHIDDIRAAEPSETFVAVSADRIGISDNVTELQNLLVTVEASDSFPSAENIVSREEGSFGTLENPVLQKLLRGPRYFDPHDSHWQTCHACGKEGHAVEDCEASNRKKPCFVCGEFGHLAKHCTQGHECFICKRRGHLAKDCSEDDITSSQNPKLCLRCGDTGHDMQLCKGDYAHEDLKGIQCYICKSFGHLCCAFIGGAGPREAYCYKCGQSGHTGPECTKPVLDNNVLSSLCYKRGEEGHFARSSRQMGETSIPTHTILGNGRDFLGFRYATQDSGTGHNRKMMQYEAKEAINARKSKMRWVRL